MYVEVDRQGLIAHQSRLGPYDEEVETIKL